MQSKGPRCRDNLHGFVLGAYSAVVRKRKSSECFVKSDGRRGGGSQRLTFKGLKADDCVLDVLTQLPLKAVIVCLYQACAAVPKSY